MLMQALTIGSKHDHLSMLEWFEQNPAVINSWQ